MGGVQPVVPRGQPHRLTRNRMMGNPAKQASEFVVGGDLNDHVGTNVDGYDGVHGGYGFGERNADGERILEFCDAMELIVTNTCFKRQKNKLATSVSGGTVSAVVRM